MNQVKDILITLLGETKDITRLVLPAGSSDPSAGWYGSYCFDTSYIEGTMTDSSCAIFIDTDLAAVSNPCLKEVTVQLSVICHKNAVALSEEDRTYYNSMGVYGNRIDCLCQMIHASLLSHPAVRTFMKNHSISSMNLSGNNPVRILTPEAGLYGKTLAYTYHTAGQNNQTGKG